MRCINRIDFAAWHPCGSTTGHPHAKGVLLRAGIAEFSLRRNFTLRTGELYVIPAHAPHAFLGAESGTDGWIFDLEATFTTLSADNVVSHLHERSASELEGWLQRIEIERRKRDACSAAMSEALYRAVNIECARLMGVASCRSYSRLVAHALDIISREYRGHLRPRDVAARVGVTPAHLSHEVQRFTGRSPSHWISHARIEAAKLRLLSSSESVSTIAATVGYADVSQLNRQFRQLTGTSPDVWRRANEARVPAK